MRAAMVVVTVAGFAFAVWTIVCAVAYATSDRQVIGGVVFEPEVNPALMLLIGVGVGLGLLVALLGIVALRRLRASSYQDAAPVTER